LERIELAASRLIVPKSFKSRQLFDGNQVLPVQMSNQSCTDSDVLNFLFAVQVVYFFGVIQNKGVAMPTVCTRIRKYQSRSWIFVGNK